MDADGVLTLSTNATNAIHQFVTIVTTRMVHARFVRSDYMAKPRWMITRKGRTYDGEELEIIEVYAPGENKETVKQENRRWTHKRHLIKV